MQQTMTLQDGCQNLAYCPNLPYFTYMINIKFPSGCNARWYAWSYRPLKCKVEWYLCWQVHHNGFLSYLILNIKRCRSQSAGSSEGTLSGLTLFCHNRGAIHVKIKNKTLSMIKLVELKTD